MLNAEGQHPPHQTRKKSGIRVGNFPSEKEKKPIVRFGHFSSSVSGLSSGSSLNLWKREEKGVDKKRPTREKAKKKKPPPLEKGRRVYRFLIQGRREGNVYQSVTKGKEAEEMMGNANVFSCAFLHVSTLQRTVRPSL